MKILCRAVVPKIEPTLMVNKIGKYLYKNIDSANKYSQSSNMVDIYFTVYYQIPHLERRPGKGEYNDIHEMVIDLNVTTYANKVRVNVIEMSPEEKTLGHFVIDEKVLREGLPSVKEYTLAKVQQIITKNYDEYDFLF